MTSAYSGLAARRHRVTLMAEKQEQGAGGRMVTTTPIIADVWAAIEENSGSLSERASHDWLPVRARFTTRFSPAHQSARRIAWQGAVYRVTALQANRTGANASLMFDAVLMEGQTP